ncbi:MAG TPA: hypothetical protein VIU12_20360 [Chryseolinea sp.]|jgi:hypothetical protein|uniref:Uncharacterized protein n=2 Tax=Chryseolinea TaxID=1433993 RepID=A0A1M5TLT7_9BACT|nr:MULTISPECIES: hypothetical protein [Chryseolinea]AYB31807.1 hypothetical protein D4L85_15075 [Chryseolinea soli]SHH51610.1 hypothetical protein SAMN04488109_4153 [Chryseolinea serpens]
MPKTLQELQVIIRKEPIRRVKDYIEIRHDAKVLIDASGEKLEDIANALCITRQSLYRKKEGEALWKPEELLMLFEYLGI